MIINSTKFRFTILGAGIIFVTLITIVPAAMSGEFTRAKAITIAIFFFVGVFIIILAQLGLFGNVTVGSSSFTPVYCNGYEFTCCNEVVDYTQSFTISNKDALVCPATSTKCDASGTLNGILGITPKAKIGTGNCVYSWLSGWKCDSSKEVGMPATMSPTEYIWAGTNTNPSLLQFKIYKQQLSFCGISGCTVGDPISSSNCVLTKTQGTIYTQSGQNLNSQSYTVPAGQCVLSWTGARTVCGNLEEQCSADTDCTGHTYGNKECSARTLQTYGCKQLGLPSGVSLTGGQLLGGDSLISSPKDYSGVKARCDITSATPVQCCGDTDCGSNMVCDTSSFTCKAPAEVKCRQNSDCGVSSVCDYSTTTLKTPKCNSPGTTSSSCGYDESQVECCSDTNCASGSTCTIDHKCQVKEIVKLPCNTECCIGLTQYIDKPCADNKFCINNACTTDKCTSNTDCAIGQVCDSGNCIDKEELKCNPTFQTLVNAQEVHYRWYNYLGLGSPAKTDISYCATTGWVIATIWGIVLVIIVIATTLIIIFTGKSKKRK